MPRNSKTKQRRVRASETIDILSDKRLMAALRRGIKEAKEGKLIAWERVKRKLFLSPR